MRLLLSTLSTICLVISHVYADDNLSSDSPDNLGGQVIGRWQGTIEGGLRVQPVSWHFEKTDSGKLRGFMGPRLAGMPKVPMDNLVITPTSIEFSIAEQHAEYRGQWVNGSIVGTWRQGMPARLTMHKKEFVFVTTPEARDALAGWWEGSVAGTLVSLSFLPKSATALSGNLSIPSRSIHNTPMVDIFSDTRGEVSFYTENRRSFSGDLKDAVLTGNYQVGAANYTTSFTNLNRVAKDHPLPITAEDKAELLGRWAGFATVVIYFMDNDNGELLGVVRASGKYAPIITLQIIDNRVEFTTDNQRSFTGILVDGQLQGTYRYPGAAATATFTR